MKRKTMRGGEQNPGKTSDATAHHPPTDAQPVPEQRLLPPSQLPPAYILSMTSYGMEYPFGQFGSAVPAMLPLVHLLACRVWEAERSLT